MTGLRRRGRARTGNVSLVIALLLVTSAVVRLFDGTAQAIAKEVSGLAPDLHGVPDGSAPAPSQEINALLSDLKDRSRQLDERRAALDLREKDLAAASLLVEQQMDRLATAESDLRALISLAETASEGDIAQLTSVYESMKPKEAAAVFEQMAPQFAAGFLGRMKPDAAARIFAGLQPATAYSISVILAGRNAGVPVQ